MPHLCLSMTVKAKAFAVRIIHGNNEPEANAVRLYCGKANFELLNMKNESIH